jgi:PAS domain S-box-containing protein
MNPAAEELFGWTLAELRGRKMHDVTHYKHPDGSPFPAEDCSGLHVLRLGRSLTDHEDVFIRKDGKFFDVVYSSSPFREDGNITGLVVVFRDVTTRKRAEEESARLAAIVTSSSEPILSKTLGGIITSWNIAAEQMFGYTAQEMIGQPILRVIPAERRAEEDEILARLRAGERIEHYETVRVAKDGRHLDVSLTISPIRDRAGRIIGASKIIHDITKRKQAEKELREAHEQLADRARQLETLVQLRTANLARTNEQLRREIAERQQAEATRDALRRQLLNAQEEERRRIARELHDQMGQNLTALSFGLKSLHDADPRSEPLRRLLPPLQALAAQTAHDLHRVALELRPAALDDLGLVKAVRNLVGTWSARWQVEADFEAGKYDSAGISSETETTLYRIMQEALNNVAKHAEARRVSVVLHRTADHVQAIIEDDGRGFDAASALQTSNGRGRLGLVGIQERLALAGGSLSVESTPGAGTSMRVRMPIVRTV